MVGEVAGVRELTLKDDKALRRLYAKRYPDAPVVDREYIVVAEKPRG